jgi:hypothetical protein
MAATSYSDRGWMFIIIIVSFYDVPNPLGATYINHGSSEDRSENLPPSSWAPTTLLSCMTSSL